MVQSEPAPVAGAWCLVPGARNKYTDLPSPLQRRSNSLAAHLLKTAGSALVPLASLASGFCPGPAA